ncbi:MAG: Npt1/Npt2 family nucleotide transporter, partial [Rickettsiaceae bacterium]|nr:Npt1/Npt2 family nucleotide transporter [Rickettsiaceae bacterium]
NHLSFERIFNILLLFFISYFSFFAFVIYPNVEFFHIDVSYAKSLMEKFPHFKWYIALGAYWSYIVFYVLAELWPNIFYILLFWQCANHITSTEEAKRFYTLFSLFGNSALIFVGLIMMNIASEKSILKIYFPGVGDRVLLVQASIAMVIFFAIISSILISFIFKRVVNDPGLFKEAKSEKVKAPKLGLVDSFKYIVRSKYLWLMLICSAAFGLSMNLVESVWKDRIKELYPNVNSYAEFNGFFLLWTGVAIMFMTIIGNNLMRSHNWFVVAVITPIIILITGTMFFILVVFNNEIAGLMNYWLMMPPIALAVSIGAVQNILSKGSKYSIWDTSREMLYIPLDQELKTKGKAAVDVISSKIGKSSSGLVQALLFTLVPTASYASISPILMVIFIIVCILWIYAVRNLYHEYKKIA